MICPNCGCVDRYDSRFCMECGQPLQADGSSDKAGGNLPLFLKQGVRFGRKRALAIAVILSAVLLITLILVLALSANPVSGRWYAQDGTQLYFLQNGKGMTVTDAADDSGRIHFMYAVGYHEAGYIEGEIYENEDGSSTWFYLYDGKLEWNGKYFYRQQP